MADLPTRSDLFAVGRRAIITTPNTRINPAVVDIPGSDLNLLIGASSLMGEEIVGKLSKCLRGLFVDTAREDQLDRVAFDRYALTRFPATPATVTVFLQRPLPGVATPGTYPQGSRVRTASGTEFATDSDAVFGAFDTDKFVNATALVAGVEGNVPPGTLTFFADVPFDPTITVNNSGGGAAGGNDAETDVEFRGRIRDFFPTLRRGTLSAIEFGARQVPGVAVSKAIEVENICEGIALPACMVRVYVADADGNSSPTMLQQVTDKLIEYRAAGIPVEVLGGIVEYVPITWDVDFASNVDTVRVAAQIRAVTVAVAQFLKPGATLYRSTLIAAARTTPGAIVNEGSLVAPVGDIVPATPNLILRVRPQDVVFVGS